MRSHLAISSTAIALLYCENAIALWIDKSEIAPFCIVESASALLFCYRNAQSHIPEMRSQESCFADATQSHILYAIALEADGTPEQYDL